MGHTGRLHGELVPFEEKAFSVKCPQCGRVSHAYKPVFKNGKLIKLGECGHELPAQLFVKPEEKHKDKDDSKRKKEKKK